MGSVVIPPAGGGGGGATNLLGTWFDPDKAYTFGSLVAVDDATPNYLGETGIFHDAERNFSTTSFVSAPADGLGVYAQYQTGPLSGQDCFVATDQQMFTAAPGCDMLVKFRTDVNATGTNVLMWFGFFSQHPIAGFNSNPVGDHAALRFRGFSDPDFAFVSKDASTQEITDTGVPAANDTVYFFRIQVRSGEVTFTLYDATFAVLAGPTVHTTNVPQDNVKMAGVCHTQTQVNADRNLQLYFCHVGQRDVA